MWHRIRALIIKELLAILRDPRGRIALVGPPLIQLFVFSYAATLDVTNFDIAVRSQDAGRWSTEFVQRIAGAPSVRRIIWLDNDAQVRDAIDMRRAVAVVQLGANFSRDIEAHRPVKVQIILDGRRSNASQLVLGYLTSIANSLSVDININAPHVAAEATVTRHWFNPALTFQWFVVPALIGMISLLISLIVTSQSVARERELGTFDQLMVSPLRTHEILIGKTVPPLIVGYLQATLFVLAAVFFFQVPLRGSIPLLYLSLFFFIASVIGVGLFISSLAQTQQQAFLGTFLFASPAILLSGFATPIENMPDWLQTFTMINPLRHFLVIVRGIFLKAMPAFDVLMNIVPLALIAAFTLTVAALLFRSRTE
jgi:ABC-2 type transport system permease protein